MNMSMYVDAVEFDGKYKSKEAMHEQAHHRPSRRRSSGSGSTFIGLARVHSGGMSPTGTCMRDVFYMCFYECIYVFVCVGSLSKPDSAEDVLAGPKGTNTTAESIHRAAVDRKYRREKAMMVSKAKARLTMSTKSKWKFTGIRDPWNHDRDTVTYARLSVGSSSEDASPGASPGAASGRVIGELRAVWSAAEEHGVYRSAASSSAVTYVEPRLHELTSGSVLENKKLAFFAIFDGHNSNRVSARLKKHMHKKYLEVLEETHPRRETVQCDLCLPGLGGRSLFRRLSRSASMKGVGLGGGGGGLSRSKSARSVGGFSRNGSSRSIGKMSRANSFMTTSESTREEYTDPEFWLARAFIDSTQIVDEMILQVGMG
jgi:hypothetical protein